MRLNSEDGESEDTSEHGNHNGIRASLLTQTSWWSGKWGQILLV